MVQVKISLDSIVVMAPDQISTRLENEEVILNLKNGIYYSLNPVGTRIWELLTRPHTVLEICNVLLAEYEVQYQRVEDDILRLLGELADHGLIEVQGGENP